MPKKFVWIALLLGGLPMTVFYIIDIVFDLHLMRKNPSLFSTISVCSTLIMVIVFRWQFLKWIKQLRESANPANYETDSNEKVDVPSRSSGYLLVSLGIYIILFSLINYLCPQSAFLSRWADLIQTIYVIAGLVMIFVAERYRMRKRWSKMI